MREARSTDEFFLRLHDLIPGFAGLILDDGVPTVYLVDLDRAALAEVVLTPFLVERGNGGRGLEVREAIFSWPDLYHWRLKARGLFHLDELRSLDISESRNRIVIGIAPGSSPDDALARLAELGVDREAVVFQEAERVPLATGMPDSLADRHRPVMGGFQISKGGSLGSCTATVNVLWEDTLRTLLTADHCVSSGNPMYQPLNGGNDRIGEELTRSTDNYHTCTPDGESQQSSRCLNSDAALILYDDSVDWSFGHIARTHSTGLWQGSTTPVGRFWVTDSYHTPFVDDTIHKVGWKSGWTRGPVVQTCKDYSSGGDWLICQTEVAAGAKPGDSGSPAFARSGYGNAKLAGTVWGAWPDSVFIYSPMLGIEEDLGNYLDVITSAPTAPSGLSISGPTEIEPDATCTWQGSVTSGTTPFSYEWRNDNVLVSETDSYTGGLLPGTLGSSFVLKFTVSNDAGVSNTQITVTEDENASPCLM